VLAVDHRFVHPHSSLAAHFLAVLPAQELRVCHLFSLAPPSAGVGDRKLSSFWGWRRGVWASPLPQNLSSMCSSQPHPAQQPHQPFHTVTAGALTPPFAMSPPSSLTFFAGPFPALWETFLPFTALWKRQG
jgi:hypothetical protein